MKNFAQLYITIDETTDSNERVKALVNYFNKASDEDKMWAISILLNRRPQRIISTKNLSQLAMKVSELSDWLFQETYKIVGDLVETISLVIPIHQATPVASLSNILNEILCLKTKREEEIIQLVIPHWESMNPNEKLVFNKLITGSFRVGVTQKTLVQAIAQCTLIEENTIAHRLMENWSPQTSNWQQLMLNPNAGEKQYKPYPFRKTHSIKNEPASLGSPMDWISEWKRDGLPSQIIKRKNDVYVWSMQGELITDKFPEFLQLKDYLQDNFVLYGDIVPIKEGKFLPIKLLQKRIGLNKVTKKHLTEVPAHFIALDLLEYKGKDIRNQTLSERKDQLNAMFKSLEGINVLTTPKELHFEKWAQLDTFRKNARSNHAEGIVLKNKNTTYKSTDSKDQWWEWKSEPLEINAVLLYAQKDQGRSNNLYTNYTFAVWDKDNLVPVAKSNLGLSIEEIQDINDFVRKNIIEKFGPVVSVIPELVFTISFESIYESNRHKSGVTLNLPRIKKWLKDKMPKEANQLKNLKEMIY